MSHEITPHEAFRFWVPSDENEPDYLVDLLPYDGNGWCDCDHFRIRLNKALSAGSRAPAEEPDRYRCKHIKRARRKMAFAMLGEAITKALKIHKHEDH